MSDGRHLAPEGVTYEYFNADPASPAFDDIALPVARCYQQTYGLDDAWGEGRKCDVCSTPRKVVKWKLSAAPALCPTCRTSTTEFWPIATILEDMRHEMQKPDAVFVIARIAEEIVGGCWGFSANPEEMEAHLNKGIAHEAQVTGIAGYIHAYHGGHRIAYQDEIFVAPSMQGLGVGRELFAKRYEGFRERGLDGFMLRTKMNPPSRSYLWFRGKWGYTIAGRYPDEDQRVVLAATANHIDRRIVRRR